MRRKPAFTSGFTYETEHTSSLEQSITYETTSGEDRVAFYSIPMEIYEYTSYIPDGTGKYTCELVTGVDRSDFTIDDRLAEMSFGPIEGQRYSDLTDDQKYFFTDPGKYKPLGNGETYQELTERIMGLMNELKDTEPGKNVLLASHGTAIHAVLAAIRDKDIEYFWDENVGNW